MGKLRALMAEISLEEGRAEPSPHCGALLHIIERLAKRARQRLSLSAGLWQRELARNPVGAAEDQRAECHIRARRPVGDAKLATRVELACREALAAHMSRDIAGSNEDQPLAQHSIPQPPVP